MNLLEQNIKKIITDEINKFTEEIIEEKIKEVRKRIADKSSEVVSKITEYVLVNSFDDPVSLRTVVQIELNKVVILEK